MTSLRRRVRPLLHRLTGPAEVTCRLFDGQRLIVVLPEIVGTALYRHGVIEEPLTRVLLDRLGPGMVFVDVGAQYGYFTLLAHRRVGPSGTVVAFEPARDTARLLRRNAGHLEGVVIEEVAVHAGPGTIELTDFGARHSALNTVLGSARVPACERRRLRGRTYAVPTVSLDDYAATSGLRPDVVKIDAEGAETAILSGMTRVLREDAPLIAIETGDYDGMVSPSTAASIDRLESLGYRSFEWEGRLQPHQRRATYGYGNLFFFKSPAVAARSEPKAD